MRILGSAAICFAAALAWIDRLVQLIQTILEADGVIVGHHTRLLNAEDRGQVMSAAQGAMGVASVGGRDIETPVVIGQQTLQHFVGLVDGLHFGQTQLLDPAILGRAERAFHAAFGLW